MPDILSYLRSFRHLIHLPDGDGKLLQRFRLQQDELAFATLVQRHGPMVLGIAQRILGQSDLLDDVFQATFLVLAKRGRQMETWPSVAGWLVQVARRTALQARAKSARRTRHERQAAAMTPNTNAAEPADIVSRRDLSQLLDAELARLPSKYRTPLVLCHLEGQTKEETARQLGWPVGSVSGRLARGKKLLQARLLRRGIVPALATGIFTVPAANAHLSSLLIQATTLLASNVVHQTSQVSASTAVVLAQGVMTSMLMTKVKYAASILLVLGLCLGTGAWAWQGQGEKTSAQVQRPKNETKTASLLEQLQGAWEVVNLTNEKGDSIIGTFAAKQYWVFRDQSCCAATVPYFRDNLDTMIFQLDEAFSPCRFDYQTKGHLAEGLLHKVRGIIRIQDGILTMNLMVDSVKDRPKTFESGRGGFTYTLRRASDYDRLEGIWRKEERNPVTNELTDVEELIFRGHHYVRRSYGNGGGGMTFMNGIPQLQQEYLPEQFELHESLNPKGIDFDIRDEQYFRKHLPLFFDDPEKFGKRVLNERNLGIYQLFDNEFKFVITGNIPLVLELTHLIPNPKSPDAKRGNSFENTKQSVQIYRRVATSYKDDASKRGMSRPGSSPDTIGSSGPSSNKNGNPTPQLLDLRQQRLKVALERMSLLLQQETKTNEALKQQQIKPLPMTDGHLQSKSVIARQVLDARLALTQDKAAQVQAMEEHLKLLQQIEDGYEKLIEYTKANRDQFPNSAIPQANDDLLAAKLRRIEFAIQIEELKEKR